MIRTHCRRSAIAVLALLAVVAGQGGLYAAGGGNQVPRPQAPAMTAPGKAFPEERQLVESADYKKSFPNLGSKFEVLAPRSTQYNCISWSIGVTSQWVWPGAGVSQFDALYRQHGYTRLSVRDYSRRPGYEKIVLYGLLKPDGTLEATHACILTPGGKCSSKLGQGPLIEHETPELLNGPMYGEPIAVYERPVPNP